ncbi:MAG: hypothetical protein HY423_11140 [Candidatus Lambdaproteobacteria bacterium]|nr:hypothetical protein [Candidatus Lambdaproteobacteria bacterium]
MNTTLHTSRRFLPPKRQGKRGDKVTQEQISQAILAFKENGGLIRKLPPQGSDPRLLVGNRWDGMYESIVDRW